MEAINSKNNINNINLNADEELVITDTMETGKNNIQVPEELMAVDLTAKNDNNANVSNQKIKPEQRKVMVPSNRMKPLKDNWPTIVKALVVRIF
jgi:hypothetical protein